MNDVALIEAILFTTDKPLSVDDIKKLSGLRKNIVEKIILEIRDRTNSPSSGIMVSESGGFRLIVKQKYLSKVSNLTPYADMSRGLMKVLSIIAAHQPVEQSEIVKIVGNRTYQYVKDLEKRGFVKPEKKSRTVLLSTTKYFSDYFGVKEEEIKKAFNKVENSELP